MMIQIEISEEDLKQYIEKYLEQNLKHRHMTSGAFNPLLQELTKEALHKVYRQTDFLPIIETVCRVVALEEIDKAARQKTPGWVRQQMKEMLKYAHYKFWEEKEKDQSKKSTAE